MNKKINYFFDAFLIILMIITFFVDILTINKVLIVIMLFLTMFLINFKIDEKYQIKILFKYLFIASMIIIIPLLFYFGKLNYKIKENPILYEKTYEDTKYSFNNLDATFYISGNGNCLNFEGHSFVEWKKFFKGIWHVNVDENITSIGNLNFYQAYNLKDVTTSDSIEGIGSLSFAYCDKLKRFNSNKNNVFIMPKNLKVIGEAAFYECDNIKDLYLFNNIKIISDNAFGECNNLENIYFYGTENEWNKIEKGNNFKNTKINFIK